MGQIAPKCLTCIYFQTKLYFWAKNLNSTAAPKFVPILNYDCSNSWVRPSISASDADKANTLFFLLLRPILTPEYFQSGSDGVCGAGDGIAA